MTSRINDKECLRLRRLHSERVAMQEWVAACNPDDQHATPARLPGATATRAVRTP
jgi:hypothetical protein